MMRDLPHNSNRQGETPQSERLDRERLSTFSLEFPLPDDVMEFLPFPSWVSYTTTCDNCQIVVDAL